MNEPTNTDRAERARDIVDAYNRRHNGADGDLATSAADLLADILHAADHMTGWNAAGLIDRARMHHAAETEEEPEPLADPMPHVRDGHTVVAFWKEDTAGHVHWSEGYAAVYDTESLEPGPTEQAECRTCGIALDPERLDI